VGIKSKGKDPRFGDINSYIYELVKHCHDAFWIRSADYDDQVFVSPAYETIWGRKCKSLYESPKDWIETVVPEDRVRIEQEIELRTADLKPGVSSFISFRIRRPDGEIRWIDDESFGAFDKDGVHIGFIGISKDVTERKNYEAQLEKSVETSEAANRAKSEFLANMSHDIRTPLSGIIGLSELMTHEFKEISEKGCEYAEMICSASQQALAFFNNCLELARFDSENISEEHAPFSLRDVVYEVRQLFVPAIKQSKLSLTVNFDSNIPETCIGDRLAVYRILLNLLGNAVKFTAEGGVIIDVSLQQCLDQQIIVSMSVTDTGIGIAEDKQKTIFEKFTRLIPSYEGKYEGTGIGLYLVDRFVRALEGTIAVESDGKTGSKFTVVLPFGL